MTLTTVAGKDADVAADEANRSLSAVGANGGRLRGIGVSKSSFAHENRRRVIAQAQTGGVLYCERAIRADFARRHFQMAAQSVRQLIAARQGADGRRAHTRHGSTQWLTGKHLIEIDNTVHVGQRHTQGAAHLGRNGFGNPAMKLLCGVQGRQKRGAALRRQIVEDGAQRIEFAIRHH